MKKWHAFLAALCLLCAAAPAPAAAYNVQAPNSWDSAGTNTWEYREVYRMCGEGKSPKYDLSYFENGNLLSRYELAGVMIDLMDNGTGLTDSDRQALDRMRRSYRRELDARGWHGTPKEKKKPIIEIHGDLRVRHQSGDNSGGSDDDARARVGFTYHVSDNTSIHAGHIEEME